MHRKVHSTKTIHKKNARDVKETCACKNCLNSQEWHNAITMCKIDVMQERCTNVKVHCPISRFKKNCDSYINVIVVIHNVNRINMELLATMKKTQMKTKL